MRIIFGMKLWLEAFASIGWNLCMIVGEGITRAWGFLRLTTVFRSLWWVLTIPYLLFRKINPEGRVHLTSYIAPKDRWVAALIETLFAPYNIYLSSTCGLGESEHDEEALRFWFTAGLLTIPAAILFVCWIIKHYGS